MVTFEETDTQAGGETAGEDHLMGQIARLLGRPKSFSRREDEWHDWSQVRSNGGDTV